MITSFAIIKDGTTFRFTATCNNKYTKGATPTYDYTCNKRPIKQADYERNCKAFKENRAR